MQFNFHCPLSVHSTSQGSQVPSTISPTPQCNHLFVSSQMNPCLLDPRLNKGLDHRPRVCPARRSWWPEGLSPAKRRETTQGSRKPVAFIFWEYFGQVGKYCKYLCIFCDFGLIFFFGVGFYWLINS